MPRRGGKERWRHASQVPRDGKIWFPARCQVVAEPVRPVIIQNTPHGRTMDNVVDCAHGVAWTTCTSCSKPRTKP